MTQSFRAAITQSFRFVIFDPAQDHFYLAKFNRETGWYGFSIGDARIYTTKAAALRTIARGDHHVAYPGNRRLTVLPITIST